MSLVPTGILRTDLYQLSMMRAYLQAGMLDTAVFEFFVRKLPRRRNFLVAGGLQQCLQYLEGLGPTPAEMEWLEASGRFDDVLLAYLRDLRFDGNVKAMPEGTIFFPDEPILRVAAPLPVAQLIESRLINLLHFQTLIASKAARMVLAAGGRMLVDFGYRRAHGAEAGLLAARAAYAAGFAGTATVEAGMAFDIPLYGTMAHSFIQAHEREEDAFLAFARARPEGLVLLIDTYDTERAAEKVADLAEALTAEGISVRGVRIDSGDLGKHAHQVRRILDRRGLTGIVVFASGGLDEDEIHQLVSEGAPIDGFGIGTALTTSPDAAALDCVYKLQEYAGLARRKWSEGKATWPGRKQVFRSVDARGAMLRDVLGLDDEAAAGQPLLQPVMRDGRRLSPAEPLSSIRQRVADELKRLPAPLRSLEDAPSYPVEASSALRRLADEVDRQLRHTGGVVRPTVAGATAPASTRWEHFPHGADVGVRGIGPSFEAALEQVALALAAIVTDPQNISASQEVHIVLAGGNFEDVLFRWLNAVIYEMDSRRLLFGRFAVRRQGGEWQATAWGEPLDVARHEPSLEPKGATYTALEVTHRTDGEWVAQCVVDV